MIIAADTEIFKLSVKPCIGLFKKQAGNTTEIIPQNNTLVSNASNNQNVRKENDSRFRKQQEKLIIDLLA